MSIRLCVNKSSMVQPPTNMPRYPLLLIDDCPIVLAGIRAILENCTEIGEIHEADSAAKALELLRCNHISICMIDIELPDMSGFELIGQVRALYPGVRIIAGILHSEAWVVRRMVGADVDAVILKQSNPENLREAVYSVLAGQKYFCPHFRRCWQKLPSESPQALSKRELEVLKCISEGLKSNEIAERLYISVNTVEFHRKQIMSKLEAKNVSDMLIKAIKGGWLMV